MSWAARRQLIVLLILLVIIGFFVFLFYSPAVFTPASCSDGKQNGTEVGVDCGGSCVNFCAQEIKNPAILWSRSFPVQGGIYNAVAYIENQSSAAARALPYEFRLYDDKDVFVARVDGSALIPPSGRYAIVETGINAGTARVARTTFEFGSPESPWQRLPDQVARLRLSTGAPSLSDADFAPKLSSVLSNPSASLGVKNTLVAVIVYDTAGNALTASKTLVPDLGPQGSATIFFSWPKPFSGTPVRYEILPAIDVFSVK